MGYIYKITNIQNNKIYIGKTTTCIRERFSKHIYEANNKNTKGYTFILHKAMRKYGIENFKLELIEEVDIQNLNNRETYWINYYNSQIPNGYNMTPGGEGSIKIDYKKVYTMWDEGKTVPQIAKYLNHSTNQIRAILSNYPNFSSELNNERVIDLTRKQVGQFDKNTGKLIHKYNSIKEAANAVQVDRSCISRCCSGQKKSSRGYIWKFLNDKEGACNGTNN